MTTNKASEPIVATPSLTRLDVRTAEEFRAESQAFVADKQRVILDLSEVNFIDSTGLGVLLSLLRRLGERNGALCLIGLAPQVSAMFHLVRMHLVFDIFETVDIARAEWR